MSPRLTAGLAGVLLALSQAACGSSSSGSSTTTSATQTASTTDTAGTSASTSLTGATSESVTPPPSTPGTQTTGTQTTASGPSTTPVPPSSGTAVVTVSPSRGTPSTLFTVSFTTPNRTGVINGLRRQYVVQVNAGARNARCVASGSVAVPASPAHTHVDTTLDPQHLGGRWCAGAYSGKVIELQAPHCAAGQVCPAFLVVVGTVGRFSFRVA